MKRPGYGVHSNFDQRLRNVSSSLGGWVCDEASESADVAGASIFIIELFVFFPR